MLKNHDDYREAVQLAIDCNYHTANILRWLNKDPSDFVARNDLLSHYAFRLNQDADELHKLLCAD